MGPMIQKEMKYNLHYGNVRGDVLPPPHGTTPAAPDYKLSSLYGLHSKHLLVVIV